MHRRVVIDSPQPPLNLGIGQRSPVMQNGRLPGQPVRGYSTEYAKRLDLVRERFGSAL